MRAPSPSSRTLQVDLDASKCHERAFGIADERRGNTLAATARTHGHGVKPAAVAVLARHRRSDHSLSIHGDKKKLELEPNLGSHRHVQIVPGRIVWKGLAPQGGDTVAMAFVVDTDVDSRIIKVGARGEHGAWISSGAHATVPASASAAARWPCEARLVR